MPEALQDGVRDFIARQYPKGLFGHQAKAIVAALGGNDVCLSTSTASGKSLVFMALASHLVTDETPTRVLALYPAKALIQDQIEKWDQILKPLGLAVGYIDGSVPMEARSEILRSRRVVLMTPDVAHAWLLSHLREKEVRAFIAGLKLLILDEAHVYEGVFGTNMAYFMRRLEVAAGRYQVVCSTATLGKPSDFVQMLTGRNPVSFGLAEDESASPPKTILLARDATGKTFDATVALLVELSRTGRGRFLAFGDSRRMVEQVVAAAHRSFGGADDDEDADEHPGPITSPILPYRAGYEVQDRQEIQSSLGKGRLVGVVSTSALELGLDIGEIDLVVMLGVPPSVKAFWQRLGRAGRRDPGICLLLDDRQVLASKHEGLKNYLQRPLEASWLYLENRYIQYANALCAAFEHATLDSQKVDPTPFSSLPPTFRSFLENELNPTEIVPSDLYPLKQRAQGGPHREFPIRSGIEQEFHARTTQGIPLGSLTFPQALREAYPGAIYHYMARPYRVYRFDYRKGEIYVRREKRWITKPLGQTMVFPRFQGGILNLFRSESGFVAESELQVSERVLGFSERRGSAKPEEHRYGPTSIYYPRELNRFFETTGVCWSFADRTVTSEAIGERLLETFCSEFSVQARDLGVGLFFSKQSPFQAERCQGICIYDATSGSLRLTQRLAERFGDVIDSALSLARTQSDSSATKELELLQRHAAGLTSVSTGPQRGPLLETAQDWVEVIAQGQKAIYMSDNGPIDVHVIGHRYTPQGLMYDLLPLEPGSKWSVAARAIQAVYGQTKKVRANLVTGEVKPLNQENES